jgi:hypothetical protein
MNNEDFSLFKKHLTDVSTTNNTRYLFKSKEFNAIDIFNELIYRFYNDEMYDYEFKAKSMKELIVRFIDGSLTENDLRFFKDINECNLLDDFCLDVCVTLGLNKDDVLINGKKEVIDNFKDMRLEHTHDENGDRCQSVQQYIEIILNKHCCVKIGKYYVFVLHLFP